MVEVSYETTIERPVEEVFRVASDPKAQLEWDDRMTSVQPLSEAPLERGATFRARFRRMGSVTYEYADFDPPRRFSHRSRMPFGTMTHVFTFDPTASGTRMVQVGRMEPTALGRLLAPVVRRMLAKRFPQIAGDLRAYLGRLPRAAG